MCSNDLTCRSEAYVLHNLGVDVRIDAWVASQCQLGSDCAVTRSTELVVIVNTIQSEMSETNSRCVRRSALMHDTPPRYVRGKARCSVFELYLRSCWMIRMTSPCKRRTLRPLNSQWVIKQHRWDVSQLTTVVRVVVKDDLVQEYLTASYVSQCSLSKNKRDTTDVGRVCQA